MGWEIIFAPRARDRLVEIVQFIGQDDPRTAVRFGGSWREHEAVRVINVKAAREAASERG